ncbi:metalloregulator ArsR/SmtB family transcription factor [Modestobacter marinus]|uniref:DNA-binding transcriptional ArsR family regulator n=1 Tax=Modestobacter marinus TaxID=477641 RepID=A0A846M349_9ACTN|nr:metalloregulator ArsR/SmtB family transcription factor [Modestobacter marinus]NIH70059.1 DNA-binding transcriptional ArsR family regulator [Modestobacter marinus]GGL81683.1 transcriptional regulator [Modestobacter marinus]
MSSDTCDLLCLDLPHAEAVRAQLSGEEQVRARANQAKALGDPTRLRIASALSLGEELCVCDLAWITELSQNLVSHHVRILRTAVLATSRRNGKLVMYRLTEAGTRLLAAVVGPAQPLNAGTATAEALS